MTIPFYQGGQVVNGVELAKVRQQLQEDSLTLTKNDIIANTVITYDKLLQTQKFRESSQASVNALEEQRKNAQLLYDMGRIARVDLLKVEVQLANDRQRLFALDEALANLGATLRYLMGVREEGIAAPITLSDALGQPDLAADFMDGLAKAHRLRPEFLISQKSVREAGLNYSIVRGKFLPSVNGFGGYLDQFGFNPSHKEANWFVGLNFNMPLFEKSLYADLSRERIQQERSEQRLAAVDNQVRLDIQTAVSSLRESKNRIATATKATEQASESFRIEREKYQSGAGAMVDLLLAQAADLTAAANYTQALFDYNAALVAWRKATGTLEDYLK
jgi:outer membrane protein TolC